MAKENKNLDQLFKEKLSQDTIKPSKLAWERLESQLQKKEKSKTPVIWWSVAASIAAVFVVGYFAYTLPSDPSTAPSLASVESTQQEVITEQVPTETTQEIQTQQEDKNSFQPEKKTKSTNSTNQKSISIEVKSPPSNLIAEEETKAKNPDQKTETNADMEELKLPALTLPNLQVNKTVAIAETATIEEPTFRVKIYSDGLEEEKTLIGGISKKVEKVEGLFNKVDQGFADLQDAKNNLFTALVSKKEKPAEKP